MFEMKISATIKPTYNDQEGLEDLLESGVDIIRLPFWRISEEQMIRNIKLIKHYTQERGLNIEILIDLPGNKIRFGNFRDSEAEFVPGKDYRLFEGSLSPNAFTLPVEFPGFVSLCSEGDELVCGDGEAVLNVVSKDSSSLLVKTEYPSRIASKKGLSITGKDSHLLERDFSFVDYGTSFATQYNLNWLALSFTSNPQQVVYAKNQLQKNGNQSTKVMAKIESRSGIENLNDIIKVSDGIMIARGDLVAYLDYSLLGMYQKMIIERCREENKFCMLSTGIMMGLLSKARPTPAEISDVTSAILSGVDSIQFCEETANGQNPEYVVRIARQIINSVTDFYK